MYLVLALMLRILLITIKVVTSQLMTLLHLECMLRCLRRVSTNIKYVPTTISPILLSVCKINEEEMHGEAGKLCSEHMMRVYSVDEELVPNTFIDLPPLATSYKTGLSLPLAKTE